MDRRPLHLRIGEWLAGAGSRVIDAREWLAERFDVLFGRLLDTVLDAFESFDSLESAIVRVVSFLLWPLVATARLLRIDKLFWFLFHLPGLVAFGLYIAMQRAAELLRLDGVFRRLSDLIYLLLTPVRAVLWFCYAWCVTRRPRELALATPALLLLLPFVYVAVAGAARGKGEIADRYRLAVREAEQEGDPELADLMRRKLEQLGVSTSRTDYLAAARLIDNGDLAAGYQRMKDIAPPETIGFAPAHHRIVGMLLSNQLTQAEEPALAEEGERLRLAEQHLDRLVELGADDESIAMNRAYVMGETGRLDQAAKLLEPFASESFRAAGMRLRLLVMDKQQHAATKQAEQALLLFDDKPPTRGRLTVEDHRSRLLAAEVQGDELVAEQALVDWVALLEEEEDEEDSKGPAGQARRQLAALSMRLVNAALTTEYFNAELLATRLNRADWLGAPRPWLSQRVECLVTERRGSNACREALNHLLVSTETSDELLQIVGTIAAAQGEITQARKAFRRLTDKGDAPAVVWNNLAWTLLQEPLPEYTAALGAIEKALQVEPSNPRYRETRGQTYVRLKRWSEAIEDLQHALNALQETPEIHAGLAAAYEALGETQLAEAHRLRGEE